VIGRLWKRGFGLSRFQDERDPSGSSDPRSIVQQDRGADGSAIRSRPGDLRFQEPAPPGRPVDLLPADRAQMDLCASNPRRTGWVLALRGPPTLRSPAQVEKRPRRRAMDKRPKEARGQGPRVRPNAASEVKAQAARWQKRARVDHPLGRRRVVLKAEDRAMGLCLQGSEADHSKANAAFGFAFSHHGHDSGESSGRIPGVVRGTRPWSSPRKRPRLARPLTAS